MSDQINQFKADLSLIQSQISKLQQDLDLKEDYIKYLEKEILIWDEELNPLWLEISNLKELLEKVLQNSENKENYINHLEQLLVSFQNKIDNLDEKINNTIEMAQPQRPWRSHTENQAILWNHRIQNATNNIRLYFQRPNIVPTLNSIVDYPNTISETGNLLEQLSIDTYQNLNNRINNAVNQITNLQTQLGALQNDYNLLNQAYRAHKLNYYLLKATFIDKKNCITRLLQKKFASHLLNRWT